MDYKITYTAHKSMAGGYKPVVYVNGRPAYLPERDKKTERGAMGAARRIADNTAEMYKSAGNNAVTVSELVH